MPPIITERLILRRFTEKDIDALYAIYSDEEANRFLPWFPVVSRAEAEKVFLTRYAGGAPHQRAICLRETDVPIGYIGVSDDDARDLGYGLRHEYWGKGYASEAAGAFVAFLQGEGVPFLTATHDVNNPASGRVMRRLGMKYQYSYVEQWQPKDFPVTFRLYLLNLDGDEARSFPKYWNMYPRHFVEKGL